MSLVTYFSPQPSLQEVPDLFPSPFVNQPHPLVQRASRELQSSLVDNYSDLHQYMLTTRGSMLGVLLIKDLQGQIGYISAFSSKLNGQWKWPGFVPPVFDVDKYVQVMEAGEAELSDLERQIQKLEENDEYVALSRKVTELKQLAEEEINNLKLIHQQKKADRKKQRSMSDVKDEILLKHLAIESQQDKKEKKKIKQAWEQKIEAQQVILDLFQEQLDNLSHAKHQRQEIINEKIISLYKIRNAQGHASQLNALFKQGEIPVGSGDCTSAKLLQYAFLNNVTPLAFGQFWWGKSPENDVRHHGVSYPACRGRCFPILSFMLTGISSQARPLPGCELSISDNAPEIIYQDEDFFVVNKPTGLLSVPGVELKDSVFTRLQARYPDLNELILVHRLDMFTSGLLLVAKNAKAHKALQRQFIKRIVKKRYVALLSKNLDDLPEKGTIELPLRVNLNDRPRQLVCYEHGKPAITHWELISHNDTYARVYFYPETGRTHQIRMHAAHKDGLDAPIVGDKLYGKPAERMMLHAESLSFIHPASGERVLFEALCPF